MEDVKDGEGEPAVRRRKLQSSNQTTADGWSQHTFWSQTIRSLRPWYSFAPAGVVWSVCQLEALLHPSVLLVDVCWRLLLLSLLWIVLGGCIHALKCCLRPRQIQMEPPPRKQQEDVTGNRNNQYSWMSQPTSSGLSVPLTLALADSLLLCVLQEPMPDPSVPHIQALLSRLELVAHTLENADIASEVTREEVDRSSTLTNKLKLVWTYLQQRIVSLNTLVQVQGDFEASVKDMLQGLDDLWAQLEELHAGVTLTKQRSKGQVAVASAQTDAETLFAVLGRYRNRLQSCQAHLKESTQLLQELTWSHTYISNNVNSSGESIWPELLLQSNMEQFDKVQESFLSLEQQTCTFQAHLEGLGKGNQLTHGNGAQSCPVSPQTSPRVHNGCTSDASLGHRNSSSRSVSSVDAGTDTEKDTRLSLRKRSVLRFSSTIGRLRLSGRKK
ncbi:uncharacterized protein [Embiotoca jacksoni]|uniref:uncharacterized protein n=1 Tax=Embiotoca jacksoni TaxID=100190 RepID=UPI0037042F9F